MVIQRSHSSQFARFFVRRSFLQIKFWVKFCIQIQIYFLFFLFSFFFRFVVVSFSLFRVYLLHWMLKNSTSEILTIEFLYLSRLLPWQRNEFFKNKLKQKFHEWLRKHWNGNFIHKIQHITIKGVSILKYFRLKCHRCRQVHHVSSYAIHTHAIRFNTMYNILCSVRSVRILFLFFIRFIPLMKSCVSVISCMHRFGKK